MKNAKLVFSAPGVTKRVKLVQSARFPTRRSRRVFRAGLVRWGKVSLLIAVATQIPFVLLVRQGSSALVETALASRVSKDNTAPKVLTLRGLVRKAVFVVKMGIAALCGEPVKRPASRERIARVGALSQLPAQTGLPALFQPLPNLSLNPTSLTSSKAR